MAKVTGSQLKVKVSQQSVQPVPASPKASLMKDSEGGDSRYQGAGCIPAGATNGVCEMFLARWNGARLRAARVRRHPARPVRRVRGHPARKAAARVRGHPARMQRPGYAGILPARQRPGYAGILPARQRPGYAGILPACSGVTCHGSESIMKIENL